MSDMQREHKALHNGQVATAMLPYEEISSRAYEIYVNNGRNEGQSERNWLQAEQELKNREEWLEANEKK
jgi:hypothetical protein